MKRFIGILLCILVLISLWNVANLYFLGEPVDAAQLSHTLAQTGDDLILSVRAKDPEVALRGWKYQTQGSAMYITARKVLTSPFFSQGSNHISLSIGALREIYLGGNLIWAKVGSHAGQPES